MWYNTRRLTLLRAKRTATILRFQSLAGLSLLGLCTAFSPSAPALGLLRQAPGRVLVSSVVSSLFATRRVNSSALPTMSATEGKPRALRLENFAKRQWDPGYKGLVIQMPMDELEAKVNELYWKDPAALKDGYAPFCKASADKPKYHSLIS